MDLSKIHKNIKNASYNTKEEFERDLRLMFENCKTYNTDTDSIYRTCCHALEQYTEQLLKTLPVPRKSTRVDPFDRDLRWNALTIKERLPILQNRQTEMVI
jgi:hypothetical protein